MPTPNPTAYEQYSLELINRARMNPLGEVDALVSNVATRTGVTGDITYHIRALNVDMALFRSQMAAFDPVAPVAWNAKLGAAAEKHSVLLGINNSQSHKEPGELGLADRIRAEGYEPWRWAENVVSYGKDPVFSHASFLIDWGYGTGGMQDPAGHRLTMLDARTNEVGIGVVADAQIGPWVVTQDFGSSGPGYRAQLLGVVINDRDGDDFYDLGEGMGGVTVTVTGASGTFTTTTWDAGGYQIALAAGTYRVVFSGGGLDGVVARQITFGAENQKLDVEADDAAPLPVKPGPSFPTGYLAGTDAAEILLGTVGADAVFAGAGADRVHGGAGNDLVSGEAYDAVFDPAAAQVYRLFSAVLGREPGREGHLSWTERLTKGLDTVDSVADKLVASTEFQHRFDTDKAGVFVDLLFNNVLGRDGGDAGRAYWTGQIESGAMTRADVVVQFSESAEHVGATVAGALSFSRAGYQAEWADDIYRLFGATLGRAPGADGLASWAAALSEGRSYESVIAGFIGSAEFSDRFSTVKGADDNTLNFVDLLFNNVLGRDGSAAGRAYWTGQIESGVQSVAQVVSGFAQSAEYAKASSAAFETWAASAGGDRLAGGTGNNVLFGGIGGDTFVFDRASGGRQIVADLSAHDQIELRGFGYLTAEEARTHIEAATSFSGSVFDDQGTLIYFAGVTPAEIEASQILI